MKKYILLLSLTMILGFTACNYLDIVPDERAQISDAYKTPDAVKRFLYSCYAYMPDERSQYDSYWFPEELTAVTKELFTTFKYGDYSPSNLAATSNTWTPVWNGIRQCYMFQSILDEVPRENVSEDVIRLYKAESDFLIAYYHFISLRTYGPTLIIDQYLPQNIPASEFPERSSYDEVVEFINEKLDEAILNLPNSQSGNDFGRATKNVALAMKSRMYLYAASPLFNGNSEMYSDFKSPIDDRHLISQEYSVAKWEKSAQITKSAIDQMEGQFKLYGDEEAGVPTANKPSLSNKAQRRIRYSVMDFENPVEVIWSDSRKESTYGLQRRSVLRQNKGSYITDIGNVIVPTLQSVEQFYTSNGLPMDADKNFDYANRYEYITAPANNDGNNYGDPSGKIMRMHSQREPRFFANIGYHNGYSEMSMYEDKVPGGNDVSKNAVLIQMLNSDPHGRLNRSDMNYSISGYVNKKWVHPNWNNGWVNYPHPTYRYAEMYLNYAEALVELGRLDEAKTYLDKIRERAGIPGVDDAWNNYSNKPGYQNTKEGMREIVRQERMNELYLEGHKFFDIRRWKIAEQHLGIPDRGLNTLAETVEDFYPVDLDLRRGFHKGQYLMPIDQNEINKAAPRVVQNPYY